MTLHVPMPGTYFATVGTTPFARDLHRVYSTLLLNKASLVRVTPSDSYGIDGSAI